MAAPTFQAVGGITSGTIGVNPPLPAGTLINDIVLCFVETAEGGPTVNNANLTGVSMALLGEIGISATTYLTIFWGRCTAADAASTGSWISDTGDHQIGRTMSIRGCRTTGDPFSVPVTATETAVDTSCSIPGGTTTVDETLLVYALALDGPTTNSTGNFTFSSLESTPRGEQIDNSRAAGNGGAIGVYTTTKATAGAYSANAVTLATAQQKAMMSFAMLPPVVATPVDGAVLDLKWDLAGIAGTPVNGAVLDLKWDLTGVTDGAGYSADALRIPPPPNTAGYTTVTITADEATGRISGDAEFANSQLVTMLNDSTDYVIDASNVIIRRPWVIKGGRNIVLIGAHIHLEIPARFFPGNAYGTGIQFEDGFSAPVVGRIVHVEGVWFSGRDCGDAMILAEANIDLRLGNIRESGGGCPRSSASKGSNVGGDPPRTSNGVQEYQGVEHWHPDFWKSNGDFVSLQADKITVEHASTGFRFDHGLASVSTVQRYNARTVAQLRTTEGPLGAGSEVWTQLAMRGTFEADTDGFSVPAYVTKTWPYTATVLSGTQSMHVSATSPAVKNGAVVGRSSGTPVDWSSSGTATALSCLVRVTASATEYPMMRIDVSDDDRADFENDDWWYLGNAHPCTIGVTRRLVCTFPTEVLAAWRRIRVTLIIDDWGASAAGDVHSFILDDFATGTGYSVPAFNGPPQTYAGVAGFYHRDADAGLVYLRNCYGEPHPDNESARTGAGTVNTIKARHWDYAIDDYNFEAPPGDATIEDYAIPGPPTSGTESGRAYVTWSGTVGPKIRSLDTPTIPGSGRYYQGPPTGGDYVPEGRAGLNYQNNAGYEVDGTALDLKWDVRAQASSPTLELRWDLGAAAGPGPISSAILELRWDLGGTAPAPAAPVLPDGRVLESSLAVEFTLDPSVAGFASFQEAQEEGAATAASDAAIGTVAWTTPANALNENGVTTYLYLGDGSPSGYSVLQSRYLKVTDFGFGIPGTATIDGIKARVRCKRDPSFVGGGVTADYPADNAVRIVKSGTISGDDKWALGAWPLALTDRFYGGPTDEWGLTWTPSEINASNFGFAISAYGMAWAEVDYIELTVYYTEAGVSVAVSGQPKVRFGPEEADAGQVLTGTSFSTEIPGGFSAATFTLQRPEFLEPERYLYASGRLLEYETGRVLHEGRVVGISEGAEGEVGFELEGWGESLADNKTARQIFYDRDISGWGQISLNARLATINAVQRDLGVSTVPDPTTGTPALTHTLAETGTFDAMQVSLSMYDARGLVIDKVDYAWRKSSTIGSETEWFWLVSASVDDAWVTGYNTSGDRSTVAGPQAGTFTPTGSPEFAWTEFAWTDTPPTTWNGTNYKLYWTSLAVIGDHGLTIQGAVAVPNNPARGILGSDVITYVVNTWGAGVGGVVELGLIEPTTFVIPHLAFKEPTTPLAIIEAVCAFGTDTGAGAFFPLDWFVYENKQLHVANPEQHGTTWRVRYSEGVEASDAGPDVSAMLNGVMVTFDDGAGGSRSVGPPGSGADTVDANLLDLSDSNPANRDGSRHWELFSGGVTSVPGAIQIGRVILADRNRQEWRGEVTIKNWVRDSSGNPHPAALVRAGDYLVIEDDEDVRPRRIVNTTCNAAEMSVSCSIGAEPDRHDVLLAQLGVMLEGQL